MDGLHGVIHMIEPAPPSRHVTECPQSLQICKTFRPVRRKLHSGGSASGDDGLASVNGDSISITSSNGVEAAAAAAAAPVLGFRSTNGKIDKSKSVSPYVLVA